MTNSFPGPLYDLTEPALYQRLGRSWCTQLAAEPGSSHFLPSDEDIGKREFKALRPDLEAALANPYVRIDLSRVVAGVVGSAAWRMPTELVAAIAVKQGLGGAR